MMSLITFLQCLLLSHIFIATSFHQWFIIHPSKCLNSSTYLKSLFIHVPLNLIEPCYISTIWRTYELWIHWSRNAKSKSENLVSPKWKDLQPWSLQNIYFYIHINISIYEYKLKLPLKWVIQMNTPPQINIHKVKWINWWDGNNMRVSKFGIERWLNKRRDFGGCVNHMLLHKKKPR